MENLLNEIISVTDTHQNNKAIEFEDNTDVIDNYFIASKCNRDIYNSILFRLTPNLK